VPVLALGEALQLYNLVDMPTLQAATSRRLGVPVPFLLVGRWGTPLPRATPLRYIIGRPIPPPPLQCVGGTPAAAEDDVNALHAAYYGALVAMFERHRDRHPDFADARIVLTDD
jgi:diacylglycerol O-acyltransferase 2, plant